jgi:3-oxoacyl-[acyl-carrier protein] reductase
MTNAGQSLRGRRALVIGGGRGIGAAIALRFAAEGAWIAIAARTEAELERVAQTCRAAGADCTIHIVDVGVRAQVRRLIAAVDPLDAVVNCAGTQGPIGPFVSNDLDDWERAVRVNLMGTVYSCREAVFSMIKRGTGSIINVSGGGAVTPRPNFSSYAVSKAAVVRFTETLSAELTGTGVRVNAIAPGLVDTTLQNELLNAGDRAGDEYERVRRMRETGQGATPPEIAAELALFLASDASQGLSGKLISAVHDPWRLWDSTQIESISTSDWYTLRRLDPHTIAQLGNEP